MFEIFLPFKLCLCSSSVVSTISQSLGCAKVEKTCGNPFPDHAHFGEHDIPFLSGAGFWTCFTRKIFHVFTHVRLTLGEGRKKAAIDYQKRAALQVAAKMWADGVSWDEAVCIANEALHAAGNEGKGKGKGRGKCKGKPKAKGRGRGST